MRRISTPTAQSGIRVAAMRIASYLTVVALLAFVAGCASNTEPVEEAPADTGSEFNDAAPPPPPRPQVRDTTISARNLTIAPVYFDLDESRIKREFEGILRDAASALRETGASVTIEGHCDERGSEEYNIALGERRANAVRSYLYNLGVPNGQMTVVSYGEARPAVNGTGETAWQLNRRAQFVIR